MEIHREVAFGYFETASVPLMTPELCKVSCREFFVQDQNRRGGRDEAWR